MITNTVDKMTSQMGRSEEDISIKSTEFIQKYKIDKEVVKTATTTKLIESNLTTTQAPKTPWRSSSKDAVKTAAREEEYTKEMVIDADKSKSHSDASLTPAPKTPWRSSSKQVVKEKLAQKDLGKCTHDMKFKPYLLRI